MLFSCAFGIAAALALRAAPVQERFVLETIPRTVAELNNRFTPPQVEVLEKLNRRDREHLIRVDPPVPGIVVPVTWAEDELMYGPFPRGWPAVASHAKFVVVHQPSQAFAAYEAGTLVRWGPASTGRKATPTPSGSFNLTWRSRSRRSTDNDAWLLEWYFNFINSRGVSFHQFELPGYAASHACVRLLQRDAQWLYGWGGQWVLSEDKRSVVKAGTPVLVIGQFAHGKPGPWTSPASLAKLIELPATVEQR